MREMVIRQLEDRGVGLTDVAELVFTLQRPYYPGLSMEYCRHNVMAVLGKREVQYALMVGILLDTYAENRLLPEPLQSVIARDEPLFGIDEVLALSITNVYGSIGLTNFGHLDKTKMGILGTINGHAHAVHTFLDDLVAGLAAAASARIAHGGSQQLSVSSREAADW